MSELFDHRQVRRAFSRAAHHYDDAAALQREVAARLLDVPANLARPLIGLDVTARIRDVARAGRRVDPLPPG